MTVRARITYCVLNLRMGGQVSNVLSLMGLVEARGFEVRLVLPPGVEGASKETLAEFGRRGAAERAVAAWRMLRGLPRGAGDVVHLVVPSPSFAAVARAAPTPPHRMVLQYEGGCTSIDAEHLRLLRDDPALIGPRLLLNHALWARLGRGVPAVHVATSPFLARWLRERGFREVVEAANVTRFDAHDERALPPGLVSPGEVVVAYLGHSHPVKGVDDLVEAFAGAAPLRPELRLVLALSDDGDRRRLERRVRALPAEVSARVRLAGLVPVAALLREVDALVLPYRSLVTTTMYPSLLLEADAAACPVVLAAHAGLQGALDVESERLSLFPPRDVRALAATLAAIPRRAAGRSILALPQSGARVDALCEVYEQRLGARAA